MMVVFCVDDTGGDDDGGVDGDDGSGVDGDDGDVDDDNDNLGKL